MHQTDLVFDLKNMRFIILSCTSSA